MMIEYFDHERLVTNLLHFDLMEYNIYYMVIKVQLLGN